MTMKAFLMVLLLVVGGTLAFWGTLMLLADTVDHFILGAVVLAAALFLIYVAQRISRSL